MAESKHWADRPILRDLLWFLVLPHQAKRWVRAGGVETPRVARRQRGHIEADDGPFNWIGWTIRVGLLVVGAVVLGWLYA